MLQFVTWLTRAKVGKMKTPTVKDLVVNVAAPFVQNASSRMTVMDLAVNVVVRFVRSASSRTLMVRILRISVRRTRILRTAVTIAVRIVVRTIAMISTKDTTTITTIIVSNTFTSGSHLHTSMYQKLFIQPH